MLQDNDFKGKHDGNQMAIMNLKKELDELRFLLNEKNRSNNDCQHEIGANREQINRKEMEINTYSRDVAQKSDHSY